MQNQNEAQTRTNLIDPKLELAGYSINHTKGVIEPNKVCVEVAVTGMPITEQNPRGNGFVDYVIFGKDGNPLALIEAKKTLYNEEKGKVQACLYADCLERQYGIRPIIYYTNGYSVKVIDGIYPARRVFGFHNFDELEHLIQRRQYKLTDKKVNLKICDRYYQKDAIGEIIHHLETKHSRSLLVLATGTGKTRVSCALSDIFIRNNYVKRILFLADRKNLVKQAKEETYDKYLDSVSTSLIAEGQREGEESKARIVFSTYQSMLSIIRDTTTCPYGIGHFDMIIIDEAHRSLFNKYAEIFDYFDALMIGLTATPRNDIHKSTYRVFNLDTDAPNYEYDVIKGVKDGYLTYFRALDRTPEILKNGVKYDNLSDDEKEEYEDLFTDDDGEIPEEIEGSAFKTIITNIDTIRQVLKQLMDEGLKVNNGDTLGKTIIFAKNHNHALMIQEEFRKMYPELSIPKANGVEYCVIIDNKIEHNDVLQREFKAKQDIRIVISVDMMDTGVDIPEVVNLVFFKNVLSKIKFWQMIGRGTRTCKNINVISPSKDYFERLTDDGTRQLYQDKQGFLIFDICNVFTFFKLNPDGRKDSSDNALSLSQKVFMDKVKLFKVMQSNYSNLPQEDKDYYSELKNDLVSSVATLNRNYIGVQSNIQTVDKYSIASSWDSFGQENLKEVQDKIAFLMSGELDIPSAKAFDRICYTFSNSKFDKAEEHQKIAKVLFKLITKGLLESKLHIEEVRKHEEILRKVVSDEFLNDSSIKEMEDARLEIRDLTRYIEKDFIEPIITNFDDEILSTGDSDNDRPFTGINTNDFRSLEEKIADYVKTNEFDPFVLAIKNFEMVEPYFNEFKNKVIELDANNEYSIKFPKDKDLIVYVRKTIGISKSAIEGFIRTLKVQKGYSDAQAEYVETLLLFISENGTFERQDILREELAFNGLFNSGELKELLEEVLKRIPEAI